MDKIHINELRKELIKNELDGLLITAPANIRYISGFTAGADARLLLTLEDQFIFTDSRYRDQVWLECPSWVYQEEKPPGLEKLSDKAADLHRIGFEEAYVNYAFYQKLSQIKPVIWEPVRGLIESLRRIKTSAELAKLREAARIGDEVFIDILSVIRAGMDEKSLADTIVHLLRQKGCEREAFDAIVVSGENAALPHGRPGKKLISPGDMVTMDFGGIFEGYAGDMTRTVGIKPATQRFKDIYQKVREAQQIGLDTIRAGVGGREVDQKVRQCLQKYGLDQYFTHSTGHGVGLDIHEAPALSFSSEDTLQENMVVTVEPGIYIPGWGGIRIEDTVVVTLNGIEILTHSSKELLNI
ncbi:MAG TPA: aminopeptidase P family protein [Syntrophomonas sp.]|jgi:Xaa-Pro aminopeptidase|nr:aminopeptidase P family protein [Syntrophomonas sp.]